MRTQVGIVGAGPAGLFLALLLQRTGVDCVVLEARARDYVESRVRAGVLEQGTVDLMADLGVDQRLRRECMIDEALDIRFSGKTSGTDARNAISQSRLGVGALSIAEARGAASNAPLRVLDVDFKSAGFSTNGADYKRVNFDNIADFTYEEFAQPHLARLQEVRLSLIEDRVDAELALARHQRLVADLEVLVADHPVRERLRGQLMVALYRSGRQADALQVFHHQVRFARVELPDIVDARDVVALQGRGGARFVQKPRDRIGIVLEIRADELDRDRSAEMHVGGHTHHAHAPFTDHRTNPVTVADDLSRQHGRQSLGYV